MAKIAPLTSLSGSPMIEANRVSGDLTDPPSATARRNSDFLPTDLTCEMLTAGGGFTLAGVQSPGWAGWTGVRSAPGGRD